MSAAPRSLAEPCPANSGRDAFRRRAGAALTHPLTLAALATLIVNDIALKRAFPDAWATGKISDLAWMVFAPPLLAYALSLLAGRSALGRRAGFGIAYAGLPLLYAAFNTFEPVHSAILRGLALVGGSGPGSPLDATDSAVIPFAMAAALWVWRRRPLRPEAVRARLALLTMAVAALATVASSPSPPVEGVTNVQADEDGTARAIAYKDGAPINAYESADGGLTWTQGGEDIPSSEQSTRVRTPSGDYYAIVGTDIVRIKEGEREVVYSAERLLRYSNVWMQIHDTYKHGSRILTHTPLAIAYDAVSGNVIAAMGLQGVVVVSPNRTWRAVAVGPFEPVDLSDINKLRRLWDDAFLWLAFALAVSFTTLGMAPILVSGLEAEKRARAVCLTVAPAVICSLFILIAELYPVGQTPYPEGSGLLGGGLLGRYTDIGEYWACLVGLIALVVAFAGIAANRPSWRQALAGAASVAGMLLLVLLAFLLWLQVNLSLGYADLFALLFVGLAALALFSYAAYSTRGSAQAERGAK